MGCFSDALGLLADKYSVNIEYFEEVASTNNQAADSKYGHGDIIITDYQTLGRGQRGNKWSSTSGENLMFTVVLEPACLPAELQFYISKIVPLAIIKVLEDFGIPVKIKWTNDVYVDDKKIAGILIENDIMGTVISRSIAGVGLNVNQTQFDPTLPNPVSLQMITGIEYDRAEVLDKFIHYFIHYFNKMESQDYDSINEEYLRNLYRRDEEHRFVLPGGGIINGVIRNVKETGELIVEHSGNGIRFYKSYLFKEIDFII
ncbi:MAG: biotin--[acetyl-CoA-carboxylase] ligase [Rikenellaceae bacterium]|nr:biotin--[acetyl-CoA-carboxylase] ligase [Rikenellaceae bacterium]